MKRMIKKVSIFALCIMMFQTVSGCARAQTGAEAIGVTEEKPAIEEVVEPVEIDIVAVGDIMAHMPQLKAQYDSATDSYDFTNNFKFVKPYIEGNDIALCNLETTFAGKDRGYSSYPRFNTPDSLSDAMKDAGFNYVSLINNHTNDKGYAGYKRTIEVLNDRGFKILGGVSTDEEKRYQIAQIKGRKIGMIAYSYETPERNGKKTLNTLPVDQQMGGLINTFSYQDFDSDLEAMKEQVQMMKDDGAEFIIAYIHWGNEYKRMPNEYQIGMSQKLNGYGVDIIFGSHPHVVQPVQMIESQDQKTLVFYSLGNFISNQCYEILKNSYTEDGMIARVKLIENENGQLQIGEYNYVPTWVHRLNFVNGKRVYEILPLNEALLDPEGFNLIKDSSKRRAKESYAHGQENMSRILKVDIYEDDKRQRPE